MRAEKFKTVSVLDPAIDHESMLVSEMSEFLKTRDFPIVSKYFKPGQKPTVFNIREVPHGLWDSYVMAGTTSDSDRFRNAFQCGVEKVENLYQSDGTMLPSWAPSQRAGDQVILSTKEADIYFSPEEREEIGSVIFKHSFLSKRIAALFVLPSLCLERLDQHRFRRADVNPTCVDQNNSKPLEETNPSQVKTESDTGQGVNA